MNQKKDLCKNCKMPEQDFKRNIAYKFRIGDLLIGKPLINQDRFSFLELGDKRIIRVNLIGNVIEKYENDGERKYSFITIDDGSGQIKIKTFGEDIEKFRNISQGQTILIIGVLRYFNNELYVSPEIVNETDLKYLLIRKLETEKNKVLNSQPVQNQEIKAIKDKILDLIKNSESEGGIEREKILSDLREASPEIINKEIQKFLEEGIVFEPRPGKVRWLG